MKTVTIPSDNKPLFYVFINGKRYSYPAGATVSVPDNVAAVIEEYKNAGPKYAPTPVPAPVLPHVTAAAEGKVAKVVDGAVVWGTDTDTDTDTKYDPLEVTGTFGQSEGLTTITLNKKAAEAYTAIQAGRFVKMTSSFGANYTKEWMMPVLAAKTDNSGTVTYEFRTENEDGTGFASASLSGTDDVVLTEQAAEE